LEGRPVRVIGTAGHVDHGKTTLIEALTGINPDRLPEEKARGMTIDLGFAWFAGDDGERVGVIDVPGHERFIRNMVAGAWSLDCALLLVAADDGWMQQTQDHAVVLAALDVTAVILVITKIDAASPERVKEVTRDALTRCAGIFGAEPPCIAVSALARRNVDALRELIIATLGRLGESTARDRFPFLYVDRVFSIKGSGLVVTGSLKGGPFRSGDELVLLPQGETVRVRGLQTYNESVEVAHPTTRLAINLQRTRGEIARGDCLTVRGAPFSVEARFVARVIPVAPARGLGSDMGETPTIRNHSEVEVAIGTGHEIAQIHFMDDRRFARIEMRKPLPALWNQPFLIIRHGGSTILGIGRALWFGEVPREDRRRLSAALGSLPDTLSAEDSSLLLLCFRGFAKRESLPDRVVERFTSIGAWVFDTSWLDAMTATIRQLAGGPAGISVAELETKLAIEPAILASILEVLVRRASLFVRSGLYFVKAPGEKQDLSPLARRLVADVDAAGAAGFKTTQTGLEGAQKELKTLARLGLVVPLEGGLCYSRSTYDALAKAVLARRTVGERFSVPEAKARTGLSRKYMLPLLNRMEKDGMLKRDGDARVVVNSTVPLAVSPL
jgi:selenocysteine-specific elongation factor